MGQLRDFFAKIGLCESTQQRAEIPGLVDKIITQSLHYADRQEQYEQDSSYEERLRAILYNGSHYDLNNLIRNNTIVCLDRRLEHQNTGFWSTEIRALFYNKGDQKILSFYDNGKLNPGFFDRDIRSYCSSIFNKASYNILNHRNERPVIAGYVTGGKHPYFTWDSGHGFNYEFERNPGLREPPLKDGPINAPTFYPD